MSSPTPLLTVFKACLNILRDNEGLTGEKALRNIGYFLMLALIEPHLDDTIDINNLSYYDFSVFDELVRQHNITRLLHIVRFSNLIQEKEDNLPPLMKYLWNLILSVNPSTKHVFLKDKGFDIQRQSTYRKIIEKLASVNFQEYDHDVLGCAYEEVIQDIMTGKVLGQFFTQPSIKKMMVNKLNPQIHADGTIDSLCDPTMGTGGFLITYLRYILKQAKERNIEPDWKMIREEGIYGKELEPDTYQLANANLLISTGHMFNSLERGDSIREPIRRKFKYVLANPPFGIKGLVFDGFRSSIKFEYTPIKTDNAVSLFIQAIVYILEIGGTCAVVLPDGQDLSSRTNASLVAVREWLMKTCDLLEVIYLPAGIFTYTSIKTCVLIFVKKCEGGREVMEIKTVISKTTQKEIRRSYVFVETHQTKTVRFSNYEPEKETETLLVEVDIKRIQENAYSLNYAEYMEKAEAEEKEGMRMVSLGEVCEINIGGTPSRNKKEYYENGTNLWVSVKELNGGYIQDTKEKITDLGVKNSSVKLFQPDTVLFSFKLSIGKTGIVGTTPLYTNEAIAGINSKNGEIIKNKYVYYYLQNNDFTKLGTGIIGNGSLNKQSLNKIKIIFPSLERQKEMVDYCDHNSQVIKHLEKEIEENKKQSLNIIT